MVPTSTVILDAGPLVSFLDRSQEHHEWVREQISRGANRLVTCEAVLTEAFFLLRNEPVASAALREMLAQKVLGLGFHVEDSASEIAALMNRYADLPMSFADACLVALSEQMPASRVFTLDRHFEIYRRSAKQPILLLAPFAV